MTTIKKPAKKKTYLDALNKVRKAKGKKKLVGKPLSKMGPVKLGKLAKRADKASTKKKK